MLKRKMLWIAGLVLASVLPLTAQQAGSQGGSTSSGIPTTSKTTKKPNIIKLGRFEQPGGLITQLYQVTPRQSRALKSFISKWLTPKGAVEEYEDLRLLEVTDTPENITRIDELLGAIDQPEPQILLQARVADITIDSALQVGVDNAYTQGSSVKGTAEANLGPNANTVDNSVSAVLNPEDYLNAVASNSTFQGGSAVFIAKNHEGRLDMALRAMESNGKAKIISSPRILTINGQEAIILTGQEFPYVSSLTPYGTGVQASAGYKEVGVKLSVIPYFIGNNTIELVVTPEVSVVTGWQSIQPGVSLPVVAKRSTSTKVNIKNEETLAIGGLIKEENLTVDKGVPLLKDIPLLGFLFRYHKNSTVKTDLVFFITPRLIQESKDSMTPIEENIPTDKKDGLSPQQPVNNKDMKK
jgi:type IV pilus assembly protein PilQ